jgi:hypothetical protein
MILSDLLFETIKVGQRVRVTRHSGNIYDVIVEEKKKDNYGKYLWGGATCFKIKTTNYCGYKPGDSVGRMAIRIGNSLELLEVSTLDEMIEQLSRGNRVDVDKFSSMLKEL